MMEKHERSTKGIWIPIEIWELKGLTVTEKVMLVEIDSLDNERGCFASNTYFSEFIGVTEVQISRIINKLKELGYVEQVSFDGRTRILKSRLSVHVKSALSSLIDQAHHSDQVRLNREAKHINTFNNKPNTKYELSFQIPMQWPDNEFLRLWWAFEKVRKKKHKPITTEAADLLLKDLLKFSGHEWEKAQEIMEKSIKRGYTEFFGLDKKEGSNETQDNDRYSPNKY